jgi:flagellar hook protein FlgE
MSTLPIRADCSACRYDLGRDFQFGQALRGQAGSSGFGLIQSGALEASNVDITTQLVNMITAQRNFQANAQMISTADSITQTIINIR